MKGTLVGLGAVGIWCITTVLVAYVTTLPPLELIALTSLLGFITMTILQLCNGEDIASYWFQPLKYYVFWLGTAGLYTILIFTSYSLVPLFEANILNHTWPVLLIIFTAMLHNERVTAIQIFGGVLGFAGVVAVFMPTADVPCCSAIFIRPCIGNRFGIALGCVFCICEESELSDWLPRAGFSGVFAHIFFVARGIRADRMAE